MNHLKLSFSIALLAMFVFFTNCSKNQEAPVSNNYENEYLEPVFQLNDLSEIENPSVEEADEVNKFRLRHPEKHDGLSPCERQKENRPTVCKDCKDCRDCKNCRNCTERNGKDGKEEKDRKRNGEKDKDRKDKEKTKLDPNSLPFILKELHLTERQKLALNGFKKDYCDCISDHLKRADKINKGALERANAKRDELIKAYKSGRISHTELMRQLKVLKENINKDTNENKDKRAHMDVIKRCRENLFRNISSILDSTQKDKFHRWVKNQK